MAAERSISETFGYLKREGGPTLTIEEMNSIAAEEWAGRRFAVPVEPIDPAALRAMTDASPMQSDTAGGSVRRMRDADRY